MQTQEVSLFWERPFPHPHIPPTNFARNGRSHSQNMFTRYP
ncbi:hypothetical protein [Candidatus Leptofilum sp.]